MELAKTEATIEHEKLSKIVKTLEEELIVKAEKIKSQENSLKKLKEEGSTLKDRLKKLQEEHEKLQVAHANSSMIRSEGGPPEVLQDYSDMVSFFFQLTVTECQFRWRQQFLESQYELKEKLTNKFFFIKRLAGCISKLLTDRITWSQSSS